uniref:Neuritin 1-like b n=1 Tax=Electrophorus electricus TaxID=8005 RepID=A0A4W4GBY8_ELEEL
MCVSSYGVGLGKVWPLAVIPRLTITDKQFFHHRAAQTCISTPCRSVYRGFAECLVTLGDNMSSQPDNAQDITAICRSWDDFQMCVSGVLSRCSGDAADIWESLRAESRRMQLSGNLYEWCAGRTQDCVQLDFSIAVACFFDTDKILLVQSVSSDQKTTSQILLHLENELAKS